MENMSAIMAAKGDFIAEHGFAPNLLQLMRLVNAGHCERPAKRRRAAPEEFGEEAGEQRSLRFMKRNITADQEFLRVCALAPHWTYRRALVFLFEHMGAKVDSALGIKTTPRWCSECRACDRC